MRFLGSVSFLPCDHNLSIRLRSAFLIVVVLDKKLRGEFLKWRSFGWILCSTLNANWLRKALNYWQVYANLSHE